MDFADFAQFAEQYQKRTQHRMLRFEKVMNEHYRQMEIAAMAHKKAEEMGIQRQPVVVPLGERSYPRGRKRNGVGSIRSALRDDPGNPGQQRQR